MKHIKYLNAVLTVIAICLILITSAVLGLFPTATAKEQNRNYATVPVNADGTISVKVVTGEPINVNLKEIGGREANSTMDVNVKYWGVSGSIPVRIK
jgi:biopolymer transport protein ExbD